MEVPIDLIAKLETLPEEKLNLIASLVNQFAAQSTPQAGAAGPVLNQAQIDKLKETLKGDNTDAIKADTEALQQAFYKIAEKIYAQTQQNPGDPNAAGVDPTADNGGADYTVVDDDNN